MSEKILLSHDLNNLDHLISFLLMSKISRDHMILSHLLRNEEIHHLFILLDTKRHNGSPTYGMYENEYDLTICFPRFVSWGLKLSEAFSQLSVH